MRWQVKTVAPESRLALEGIFEAESESELRALLQKQRRVVISARPVRGLGELRAIVRPRFSVPLFCEELKSLLDAGLSLTEALEAMRATEVNVGSRHVYDDLIGRIREGKMLSAAMEEQTIFPVVLTSAVRGAEHTSGISGALARYLDYYRRTDELRSKVISASIYPTLVLGLGIAIVLFLLAYVVPRFATIYVAHASNVSLGTRAVLALGRGIADYWFAFAIAGGVAAYWLGNAVLRLADGRATLDFLKRIRWLRPLLADFESARIFETLAIVLKGGFTVPYALTVARGVCLLAESRASLAKMQLAVESGQALHSSIRQVQLGDEIAARLAGAGAESGDLATALHHAGEHYSRRFGRAVERLTRFVEPMLLLIIGTVVGGIVLMMYMPIFDLAGSIGR